MRFPENTVDSFEEALRSGADGFETDLRMLADGTPVLFHDDDLRGRPVETYGFEECRAAYELVQPLADLTRFAGRTTMILEVKRRGWEGELVERIAGWPGIVVASFDHLLIAELSRRRVPFPLGLTIQGAMAGLPEYAGTIGATWCFPNYRHLDQAIVESLRARSIRVVPWTPNRPEEWRQLRDFGCDGIITDDPAEAVAWRASAV